MIGGRQLTNDSDTREASSGLEGRGVLLVSDEGSVVEGNDGRADEVGAGREVDEGGGESGRLASVAVRTTAVSGGDGAVDSGSIISYTCSSRKNETRSLDSSAEFKNVKVSLPLPVAPKFKTLRNTW